MFEVFGVFKDLFVFLDLFLKGGICIILVIIKIIFSVVVYGN